jgi:hypothetical protein
MPSQQVLALSVGQRTHVNRLAICQRNGVCPSISPVAEVANSPNCQWFQILLFMAA